MSEIDDRIRQSLARQAGWVPERSDYDGLTDRISRRHRRRMQGVSVALVLALVAGPALGFLAGRSGGRRSPTWRPGPAAGSRWTRVRVVADPQPGRGRLRAAHDDGRRVSGGRGLQHPVQPERSPSPRRSPGSRRRLDPRLRRRRLVAQAGVAGRAGVVLPNGYVQADVSTANIVGILGSPVCAELPGGPSVGVSAPSAWPRRAALGRDRPGPGGVGPRARDVPRRSCRRDGAHRRHRGPRGPGLARAGRHGRVRDDRGAEAFDEHGGSSAPAPRTGGWIQTGAGYPTPQLPPPGEEQPSTQTAAPRSSSSSA